jgi:hypothetical protein
MAPKHPPTAADPLFLLGWLLEVSGAAAQAAGALIPACQEAAPDFAARLEDLRTRLEHVTEDIADAPHPLLARRIAEAQKPTQGHAT